jgi:hypothetical protein
VRLEGLGKLKKSSDIENRSRDIPACSTVPQPTTLPHVPWGLQMRSLWAPPANSPSLLSQRLRTDDQISIQWPTLHEDKKQIFLDTSVMLQSFHFLSANRRLVKARSKHGANNSHFRPEIRETMRPAETNIFTRATRHIARFEVP